MFRSNVIIPVNVSCIVPNITTDDKAVQTEGKDY